MAKIQEKLDYSFSIQDFVNVEKYLQSYIEDRVLAYNNNFISYNAEVEKDFKTACQEYISYYVSCNGKDDAHPALDKLIHFINRNYEVFALPEIMPIIDRLKFILQIPYDEIDDHQDFILDYEVDSFNELKDLWARLGDKLRASPRIILKDLNYLEKYGCQIYYDPHTSQFVLNTFLKFLSDMKKAYPRQLMRMDLFLIVDSEFIEFSCGVPAFMFFLDNEIYLPCNVKPEEERFFTESIYHEMGHQIFELMSESSQLVWQDYYKNFVEKDLKLTRETDNECEELFADCFSLIHTQVHDFIQPCSSIILNTCKELLSIEFGSPNVKQVGVDENWEIY